MKFPFKAQRIVFFVNISMSLLLILAFLFFAKDVISIFMRQEKRAMLPEKKADRLSSKKGFQDYAAILKNNPFGFPGGELKLLSASSTPAPSIPIKDLSLIGTVSGSKKVSYAIFSDRKGNQEIFAIGDSVFGIGMLERVEKEMVFLNDHGREIEITIAELEAIKDFKKLGKDAISYSNIVQQQMGDDSYILSQKKVLEAIENPNQLMTDARLQPHMVEGRQEGFIIKEVKPGGIYHNIGLKNEDVLLRINEFPINKPDSALQAFTALKGMDRVQLDIIRDGTKMTMTYQMR